MVAGDTSEEEPLPELEMSESELMQGTSAGFFSGVEDTVSLASVLVRMEAPFSE